MQDHDEPDAQTSPVLSPRPDEERRKRWNKPEEGSLRISAVGRLMNIIQAQPTEDVTVVKTLLACMVENVALRVAAEQNLDLLQQLNSYQQNLWHSAYLTHLHQDSHQLSTSSRSKARPRRASSYLHYPASSSSSVSRNSGNAGDASADRHARQRFATVPRLAACQEDSSNGGADANLPHRSSSSFTSVSVFSNSSSRPWSSNTREGKSSKESMIRRASDNLVHRTDILEHHTPSPTVSPAEYAMEHSSSRAHHRSHRPSRPPVAPNFRSLPAAANQQPQQSSEDFIMHITKAKLADPSSGWCCNTQVWGATANQPQVSNALSRKITDMQREQLDTVKVELRTERRGTKESNRLQFKVP